MIWILVFGFYAFLMSAYAYGWLKSMRKVDKLDIDECPKVTVVVSLRNEEVAVGHLMNQFENQSFKDYNLILVDDNSTDNTYTLLQKYADGQKIILIKANNQGKKQAIRQAVSIIDEGLVVCTDADCSFGAFWLESIVNAYRHTNADLLIGPVMMDSNKQLQALEFLSLSAVTGGSAFINRPVMCNGANLAFVVDVYKSVMKKLHDEQASGDDMFLLSAIKLYGGDVEYIRDTNAIVTIEGKNHLNAFLNQRARWVSKSKTYTDKEIMFVGAIVVSAQLLLILSLILIPCQKSLLVVWLVKYIFDLPLLFLASRFFKQERLLLWSIPASLVYPFYVAASIIFAMVGKIEWKGRKI
ncbi:MAG: glycosyltransferase [Bacteroidia bacterium]|nr:glycosyltransferase [Bacteroidia bacterium]